MTIKIFGALKRISSIWCSHFGRQKSEHLQKQHVIKLATVQITPTLRLLSFRVSRNYLYFSFATPTTDLVEYVELFDDELS
ncbi:unnamed protein product [Colias eurytheme]|nr:unnamed protein product [Colias eurytheme]